MATEVGSRRRGRASDFIHQIRTRIDAPRFCAVAKKFHVRLEAFSNGYATLGSLRSVLQRQQIVRSRGVQKADHRDACIANCSSTNAGFMVGECAGVRNV
jgi:hypothetical protein